MLLGSGHVRISMANGLRFSEAGFHGRHEVSSKKNECVVVYSLESRDLSGATEKISVADFQARCPLRQASISRDKIVPTRSQCQIVFKFMDQSWVHEGVTL